MPFTEAAISHVRQILYTVMLSSSGITPYSAYTCYLLTSAGRSFPRPHLVSLTCPGALAVQSKPLITGVDNGCLEVRHRIINITIDRVVQGWAHNNYACMHVQRKTHIISVMSQILQHLRPNPYWPAHNHKLFWRTHKNPVSYM